VQNTREEKRRSGGGDHANLVRRRSGMAISMVRSGYEIREVPEDEIEVGRWLQGRDQGSVVKRSR